MKYSQWLLLCSLALSCNARAADFGLTADYWDYRVSGTVNRNGASLDLKKDLDVEARRHMVYGLAWNTGPGWWRPDIAASYTPIRAGGERIVDTSTSFGSVVLFPGSSVVLGDADLKDIDVTLRYPLKLGRGIGWGGATLKRINGTVTVRDRNDSAEDIKQVNQIFPMLHAAASVPIGSWLSLSLQGNAIRYRKNSAYELHAGASVGLFGPVGLNLGWQRKHYKLASTDYALDTTLSGFEFGVFAALR